MVIHHVLLDMDDKTLQHFKQWAAEECDNDRYNRKVCITREQREYWNGRLNVHLLLKAEADCEIGRRCETVYAKKRREAEASNK